MAATFLELVNDVVFETKVTLDPLTSSNFATPPRTTMYNRFKRWINMAYKELLIDRPEWQFRIERAIVDIWPRIHLAGLNYVPSVGDILIAQNSGVEVTVYGVHSFEETVPGAGLEYTLDVLATDNNLQDLHMAEYFDLSSPTVSIGVGYLVGAGNYNFHNLQVIIDDIRAESIRTFLVPEEAEAANNNFGNPTKVIPLKYEDWQYFDHIPWSSAVPQYITQGPDGNYMLFPQPNSHQLLTFNYSRTVSALVNWNDTPDGLPDKYQDYLVWRTVQEYSDFDNDQKLFLRASKHVDKYLAWLGRDELPTVGFGPNLFSYRR